MNANATTMETIDDLIELLESEAEAADEAFREFKGTDLGCWHSGRRDAYRHALAQAKHVKAKLEEGR